MKRLFIVFAALLLASNLFALEPWKQSKKARNAVEGYGHISFT